MYAWSKLVKIMRGTSIRFSTVHPTSRVHSGSAMLGSAMDRHSFAGYDCSIINADIGAFCSLANRINIGGVAHPAHFVSTSPVFLSHKDSVKAKFSKHDYLPSVRTSIAADVWIGEGAFIKAGVNIGVGAIVGMGAVVTRDVPPYTIVGGNPARIIRSRFDESIVKGLLASKWWTWSDDALTEYGPLMCDPAKFLEKLAAS